MPKAANSYWSFAETGGEFRDLIGKDNLLDPLIRDKDVELTTWRSSGAKDGLGPQEVTHILKKIESCPATLESLLLGAEVGQGT